MKPAVLPSTEAERLAALRALEQLDTEPEPALDAIVSAAARVCGVPIALVSLVDERRQWFKASVGLEVKATPRDHAFCAHAILRPGELMEVKDSLDDERFADNPLVTGAPHVRFYAGVPLVDSRENALGTLCVIDRVPRELDDQTIATLRDLSAAAMRILTMRGTEARLRRAEDVARRAASDLQAVLDTLPAMVGYWDKDLTNRFANDAYTTYFGKAPGTIRGMKMRDALGPELFARNERWVTGALRGEPQRFERALVDREGRERKTVASYLPDVRDGEVQGFYVLVVDVTEQKETEAALEAERKFLQTVLEALPDSVVYAFDEERRVTRVIGGRKSARASADRDLGKTPSDLDLPQENRAALDEALGRALGGEPTKMDVRRGKRNFEVNVLPLPAPAGTSARGIVVTHDVTQRDRLRSQLASQERLITIGTLAAGVGHEINNPLSYLIANLEMAREELGVVAGPQATRELDELLASACDGAERIREVVRGLRALTRGDSVGRPTDLHEAIHVATRISAHEIRGRLQLSLELGPVPKVLADEGRLAQVVVNLLINAAHAFGERPSEQNHVTVRTRSEDGRAVIEVEDDGPGMDEATASRVFEPFFTTKPPGKGTGLGLAICHGVVTSLGGQIVCETAPGMGARFRITLPGTEASSARANVPEETRGQVRGKVLLVDDDVSLTASLARALRSDHEVAVYNDAAAALAHLEGEHAGYDVVFCDVMMPGMSGPELYRRLREKKPELARRFVFISGGILYPDTQAFFDEVENERLEKPLAIATLRAIAQRFAAKPTD